MKNVMPEEYNKAEYANAIAKNLLKIRHVAGMTQRDMAIAIGVGESTISKYECHQSWTPQLMILLRICDYFGVSLDAVCGREPLEIGGLRV